MSYSVTFQTASKYKNIKYGSWGGTIYSSGCGCAAFVNAYRVLTGKSIDLQALCKRAEQCGARVNGGTLENKLLNAIADEYGITWRSTSKNAELLAHLQAGGVAILHGGSSYKLFSSSGHFVAAVSASGQTITVLDSYWYSGKYTQTTLRKQNVKVLANGVIQTSLTNCGKATIDRSPSYYLISKKTAQKTTKKQEDDEVVEKTKFKINGSDATLNAITKDGTTFANLREYNTQLGLVTGYNNGTRTVEPGTVKVQVDGKAVSIPGMAFAGSNYVAVRALCEALGYTVGWNQGSKTVTLTKA